MKKSGFFQRQSFKGILFSLEKSLLNKIKISIVKSLAGGIMETEKKFNKRGFVSAGLFLSGIGLPVSGIMNHYLGFEGLTTTRHAWMSVHNVLSIFFVFFCIWHLKLNWKALMGAIKKHSAAFLSREALYAALLVFGFLGLFVMHAFHARG